MDESLMGSARVWKRKDSLTFVLISFIIVASMVILYRPALSYPPSNGDDLVLLSKASQVSNPLSYLVSDWGLGNNAYRPIHSISIWLVYQKFGVWALPNQLLNLGFHCLNLILIFYFLYRQKVSSWIAGLLVILFGSCLYAISPATWVSDRPTLLVAFCLTLTLILITREPVDSNWKTRFAYLFLTIFALLSKESGLLVPVFMIGTAVLYPQKDIRWKIGSSVACILVYFVLRFSIFSSEAYDYSESGYLLGVIYYPDSSSLSPALRIAMYVDNFLKNIAANILLIFGPEGQILSWADIQQRIWMIIPLPILFFASVKMKNRSQLRGISIIVLLLNALVHFQLFRYRTLYIGFEAVILFIGSMFVGKSWNFRQWQNYAAMILLVIGIYSNWTFTQDHLTNQLYKRTREINKYQLQNVISERGEQLSQEIIQQVMQIYSSK